MRAGSFARAGSGPPRDGWWRRPRRVQRWSRPQPDEPCEDRGEERWIHGEQLALWLVFGAAAEASSDRLTTRLATARGGWAAARRARHALARRAWDETETDAVDQEHGAPVIDPAGSVRLPPTVGEIPDEEPSRRASDRLERRPEHGMNVGSRTADQDTGRSQRLEWFVHLVPGRPHDARRRRDERGEGTTVELESTRGNVEPDAGHGHTANSGPGLNPAATVPNSAASLP